LIGRLTKDPEIYRKGESAVAAFTLAVDRAYSKEKEADFIRCKAFGKTADIVDKFCGKGKQVGIQGRIQTGSYDDKDGKRTYTTDVIVDRLELLGGKQEKELHGSPTMPANLQDYPSMEQQERQAAMDIPEGFHAYDEEDDGNIPF
jgi:single-strand DNA-binding protein